MLRTTLINAPLQLQRGARAGSEESNRFSGLNVSAAEGRRETAKAVKLSVVHPITALKRGVNESGALRQGTLADTQFKLYPQS